MRANRMLQSGIDGSDFFSPDYFVARDRFRRAAALAGGGLEALRLDAKGPGREDLTIDLAWFGAAEPRHVLLHCSGTHGVEGFAGSAIQLQLLEDLPPLSPGTALVMVHILNPFGMAWLRRTNENNVDLNRNFRIGACPSASSSLYPKLDSFLNPKIPPAFDFFLAKACFLVCRYGQQNMKQSVAGGQQEFPRGLFYGGTQMEAGPRQYEAFLKKRLVEAERAVVIDVHTGLGKFAEDSLLVDSEDFILLRTIFGERVAALQPEQSPAYRVDGGMDSAVFRVFSNRPIYIGQEFGTYSSTRVLHALREENRWHHNGGGTLDHPAKLKLKDTFSPAHGTWRETVLRRGRELFLQAMAELSRS